MRHTKLLNWFMMMVMAFVTWSNIALAEPAMNAKANKNGEMLAFIMAVDDHEIKAADAALAKQTNAAINSYAKTLQADHQKNLNEAQQLAGQIPVNQTPAIDEFKANGEKKLDKMKELDGKKFEVAFIDAMIAGHKAVLAKLKEFIKDTNNSALKQFLESTQVTVQAHLTEAMDIKKNKMA